MLSSILVLFFIFTFLIHLNTLASLILKCLYPSFSLSTSKFKDCLYMSSYIRVCLCTFYFSPLFCLSLLCVGALYIFMLAPNHKQTPQKPHAIIHGNIPSSRSWNHFFNVIQKNFISLQSHYNYIKFMVSHPSTLKFYFVLLNNALFLSYPSRRFCISLD